jgi:hypothetical protein
VAAAYGALVATAGLGVASVGLYLETRGMPVHLGEPRILYPAFGVAAVAFAAVGAIVLVRRPGNVVGWLFSGVALCLAVSAVAHEYAIYAVIGREQPLPGGAAAAWMQSWAALSSLTTGVGLLFLVFPDGRLLSRRWRWAAGAVAVGFAFFVFTYLIDPRHLDAPYAAVKNPFGIEGAAGLSSALVPVGFFLSIASILAAALSLVLRFRRAGGVERQQIKWLAYAGAALAVSLETAIALEGSMVAGVAIALTFIALVAVPVSAGLAIFRYRLYEIDVVINRTLVYGSLTALLAATYFGLVVLLQLALRPLTGGSSLAVALSTLAVAGLFRPARTRIQAIVDRRFYRRKYDAERTLEAFTARLRDELDVDALRAELTAVVGDTMQPAHVSLWLRPSETAAVTAPVTISGRSRRTTEAG